MHFAERKSFISNQIAPKFIAYRATGKESALVRLMGWWRRGDKLFSDEIMTDFTDSYMYHQSFNESTYD